MFVRIIVAIILFVLEFVLSSLPYKIHKRIKTVTRLEIGSMCVSAIVKVIFLYAIVAPIYIVLLKVKLKMPLDEVIHDIFFYKWNVIFKFHAIVFVCLLLIFIFARFIEFYVHILPSKTDGTKKSNVIFSSIFLFLFAFFALLYIYVGRFFPDMDVDQLFFTLFAQQVGMSGELLQAAVLMLLVIPFLVAVCNFTLGSFKLYITIDFSIKTGNIFPITIGKKIFFSCVLACFALLVLFIRFPIIQFIKREMAPHSTFYEMYYIDPQKVQFKFPEKKKNLIFIYLESLEAEGSGDILNGVDLIPELSELAKNNLSFSHNEGLGGALQVWGTTNSIASCCNTHVGLPMVMYVDGRFGKYATGLFSKAYGLGNILSNEGGYLTSYLIGSYGSYYGMNLFLESHGFPLKSLEYWKKIKKVPDDYFVWWGVEDKKLVEYAKEELLSLASQQKPFAFSVFFEDPHVYGGYVCEECGRKYSKSIHNVYECTSRRIGKFIEWMKGQDFYKDSVIVILGDHLYMGDDLYDDYAKTTNKYCRHAYNVFINIDKDYSKFAKNRSYCTFDYFPTIIDCLGIEYEEQGLGIGRSLVREGKTLLEELGEEKLSQEMVKKNVLYRKLLLK